MDNWYLVQLKRNSDSLARRHLNEQGFKTFLPLQNVTSRGRTKFSSGIKPLFPGYLFVSIDLNKAPWRKINSTVGVSRLICQDGIPHKVPSEIVSALIARCDSFGVLLPPKSLKCGDSVVVVSGAFANFIATVEAVESNRRIWILMDMIGQSTRVQIASEQLQFLN